MKKDGFIIYASFEKQVEVLDDSQAGILFKALLRYQSGKDLPAMDQGSKMAFSFIAASIDANNEKYEKTCQARSKAGKKGNEKRWHGGDGSQKSQMRQNETVCDDLRQDKGKEEDIEKEFDTEKEIEEKGRAPNRARNGERQKNRFNQFTQNEYDFDELERKLISN